MNGVWLALDTAAPRACIAVVAAGQARSGRLLLQTRRHAEELAGAIEFVLTEAEVTPRDLLGVAVGAGPGSFVGVRVGIAHAKGLCAGLRVPLVGLCSLTALACEGGLPEGRGLAVLDARQGEVYALEIIRENGAVWPAAEPEALTPDAARERARGLAFVVGNALDLIGSTEGARVSLAGPSAAGLATALKMQLDAAGIVDERETLVPRYCRAPDAKLPGGAPAS